MEGDRFLVEIEMEGCDRPLFRLSRSSHRGHQVRKKASNSKNSESDFRNRLKVETTSVIPPLFYLKKDNRFLVNLDKKGSDRNNSCSISKLAGQYTTGVKQEMIVKNLSEIINTARDVDWGNGQSRRFLLERDGMGYSLTDTIINAGTESLLEYKNHMEACYCIEGEGEVEAYGILYPIQPGTMYALDKHDKHYLRAKTTMRLVCVFTPPLQGNESHNFQSSGSSCY